MRKLTVFVVVLMLVSITSGSEVSHSSPYSEDSIDSENTESLDTQTSESEIGNTESGLSEEIGKSSEEISDESDQSDEQPNNSATETNSHTQSDDDGTMGDENEWESEQCEGDVEAEKVWMSQNQEDEGHEYNNSGIYSSDDELYDQDELEMEKTQIQPQHGMKEHEEELGIIHETEDSEHKTNMSILLIHDDSVDSRIIGLMRLYAWRMNIDIQEQLITFESKYLGRIGDLSAGDVAVVFSTGTSGINFILDHPNLFEERTIVVLSDAKENLKGYSPLLFKCVSPETVVLSNLEDIDSVWDAIIISMLEGTPITKELQDRGVEYIHLDKTQGATALADAVASAEFPLETIKLLLLLPFAATVVAIFRNIVGIRTYGIFGPAILSIAFLSCGLPVGLMIFATLLFAGTSSRYLIGKFSLMVVPRMAVVITSACLVMAWLIILGLRFGYTSFAQISFFPLVITSAIIENFMRTMEEKGIFEALKNCTSTLIVAMVCFAVVSSSALQATVILHPEILTVLLGLNILIGRWKGLRLTEYFRFSELIRG